jgi:ABC-type transport system substrate-binding protein
VSFTILTLTTQSFVDAAQYFQGILNSYKNVKVNLEIVSAAQRQARVRALDFQTTITSVVFNDPDPKWGQSFVTGAVGSTWKNSAFDAAIAEAKVTDDSNKRIGLIREAVKQWNTDLPGYFFDRSIYAMLGTSSVQDIVMTGNGAQLYDRMWLKTHG